MDGLGSLIGGTVGFLGSAIPKVIEVWQAKEQRKHDLAMRKIDLDAAAQGHGFRVVEKNVDADIAESKSLYEHDTSFEGGPIMDALRASVRPVITYVFFVLFLIVKISSIKLLWAQNVPLAVALPLIWDTETSAIFAAIIAFWFGQRAMARFRFTKPTTTILSATGSLGQGHVSVPSVWTTSVPGSTTPVNQPVVATTVGGTTVINK